LLWIDDKLDKKKRRGMLMVIKAMKREGVNIQPILYFMATMREYFD